ncbi:hypothetical protein DID88_000599 [Monilinia fructigena]|uniref:Uncharacterized protein n=1 Tax=Monilinia fructigena TaxID=38457 RepID=A0A395IKS2_9HELO|nr:hypothetical protein DID88_000599 [Monilinia fructigena]
MAGSIESESVQTEWGTVAVYKGNNYIGFMGSLRLAITASDTLEICPLPFQRMMRLIDVAKAWKHLHSYDDTSNSRHISNIRRLFLRDTFDPQIETLQQFLDRLRYYQLQTSTSDQRITDVEVHHRFINSLPDTPIWQTQRDFVTALMMDTKTALYTLQQIEKVPQRIANPANTTGSANVANALNSKGGKTKDQRGRSKRSQMRLLWQEGP